MKPVVLFVVFMFAVSIPASADSGAEFDRIYTPGDCGSGWNSDKRMRCGTLRVPSNHFDPDGTYFELPVVRISIDDYDNPSPPLVYLDGGPGSTTNLKTGEGLAYWVNIANGILFRRDLIVLEMRGSKYSQPALDCPSFSDPAIYMGILPFGQARTDPQVDTKELWRRCLEKLRAHGVDLSVVNRHQVAEDVKLLADGLGAEKISLYGASYGTTYAMTVMEEFPDLVADAVLDSVFPPEATSDIRHTLTLRTTLAKYFSACSEDPVCNASYPDLEHGFFEGVKRLWEDPVEIVFIGYSDLQAKTVIVDAALYLTALRDVMGWPGWQVHVPFFINAAEFPSDFAMAYLMSLHLEYGFHNSVSTGASFSSMCYDLPAEIAAPDTYADNENETVFVRAEMESWGLAECEYWSELRAPDNQRRKLVSSIPTLVLAGELDPATPPYQSRMAVSGLKHAYYFEFPSAGHAISFSDSCAKQIIWDFLRDSDERPHRNCLKETTKLEFVEPG
ncbi:alpha/beta hydrolase [Hoeflea poritis]|uniref:Alpha/beta hydrolase n=1 Tax=Hoeflea poritis TaxID=2993659 RepID=A0ABT4VMT8_9HYPH|nr:alpha/beta hydrolase [Hoeflea poritis]MDA4845437.1 alpha/beta hydrolase [Hoeflea poritis]